MRTNTMSHRAPVSAATESHSEKQGPQQPIDPGPQTIERLDDSDNTLQARYGVWIQTLKNHPIGTYEGVYLSTFQRGRGQHVTALDTGQARKLGKRLIALADEVEAEAGAIPMRVTE